VYDKSPPNIAQAESGIKSKVVLATIPSPTVNGVGGVVPAI
jgi:hypothetical protein